MNTSLYCVALADMSSAFLANKAVLVVALLAQQDTLMGVIARNVGFIDGVIVEYEQVRGRKELINSLTDGVHYVLCRSLSSTISRYFSHAEEVMMQATALQPSSQVR